MKIHGLSTSLVAQGDQISNFFIEDFLKIEEFINSVLELKSVCG